MCKRSTLAVWILSLWVIPSLSAQAPSADDVAQLVAEIEALQSSLEQSRQTQTEAEQRLESVERDIAQTQRERRQVQADLDQLEQELAALLAEQSTLEAQQATQQTALEQLLVQVYRAQRSGDLKLWLSPGSMSEQARLRTLYDHLSSAQIEQLTTFIVTLEELASVRAQLTAQTEQQQRLLAQLTSAQARFQEQREQRQARLQAVAAEISSQEQALAARQAERAELERLLEAMQSRLEGLEWQLEQRPLNALQGQLPRPVSGELIQRFGQRSGRANIPTEGVLFAAAEGDPVRAIHEGRVVFADYLKGYGLLLIIDHGDGYLSLYGRNQGLMRAMGDWVQPGDVIAEVGDSGGFNQLGLYFELRLQGRPMDPMQWLR